MGKNEHDITDKRTLVPEERRRRIERHIREFGGATGTELQEEFAVSQMTVRRDLAALESEGKVRRTHGGAVPPGVGGHEDSFQVRLEEDVESKQRLARSAVGLMQPGETVFMDGSTTAYQAARSVIAEGVRATLLTNLVPAMELFRVSEAPNTGLIGLGGSLRKLTQSFVGPQTVRMVRDHFADRALLSVKGITPEGYLTDPDPLEAEVKRAMIEHSEQPVLLVDGRKLDRRGLNAVAHVCELSVVLVAGAPESRIEELESRGVEARLV